MAEADLPASIWIGLEFLPSSSFCNAIVCTPVARMFRTGHFSWHSPVFAWLPSLREFTRAPCRAMPLIDALSDTANWQKFLPLQDGAWRSRIGDEKNRGTTWGGFLLDIASRPAR